MKSLLTFLATHPTAFGAILGASIAMLQCRRLVRRLERGDLQVSDATQPLLSVRGLWWFLKAMFI